ncbi:MAG: single-stranded DNA-binding protein [Lentisphaerae bacterium]|nr:single-stranded DNA-binding protein [Lentisphaerota bacterium]
MASLNKVFLMGNLTKDPEVRYIPSGKAVCEMGLAVNESYRGKDGNPVEQTIFVDVVVWERQAETCGEYLRKGSPVMVEGRLQLDKWKTKEGENRSKLRVRADRVQFLSSPRSGAAYKDSDGEQGGAEPAAEAPAGPGPGSGPGPEPAGAGDDDNLPF